MAKLIIDPKTFDEQVWQTHTGFTNEQYNEWMRNASNTLQQLREEIEDDIDNGCCDVPVFHLNIMGDVINLLSAIQVDAEHRGESWTCTRGDFDDYVLDGISEETIEDMIDEVSHGMGNNDCVADCYWQHVSMTAQEHGLQKQSEVIDWAKDAVKSPEMRYAICTICTKDDHERMENVIIALFKYDENTEKHDDEIYFYAGSAEEFLRICREGADEFTICAIDELSTEI